eukprot:TRINITY_DN11444_c0_g1_i12.p1 TRINITY_DN11444_c0_g1~~TRINITY_DN11444_c0_g1_i12.p1  ORF type:complete len:126 (-),score=52.69 TRINITY_DN11444_c0_g1_i12:400-777(-)
MCIRDSINAEYGEPSIAMDSGEGISQLLLAERQAAEMVSNAKKAKQEKLNAAKAEAEKEIAKVRESLQADHEKYKSEHGGGSDARLKAVQQETQATINKLQSQASQNQSKVVDLLVKYVTQVEAQ